MDNSPLHYVAAIKKASIILITGFSLALLTIQSGYAQTEAPQTEADFNKPAYSQHSGSSSIYYTLAIGVITSSTPLDFLKYQKKMGDDSPAEV